jgi:hypothetical protein
MVNTGNREPFDLRDEHAIGVGRTMRSDKLDFFANPINAFFDRSDSTRRSRWSSAQHGT